MQMEDVIQQ